MMSVAGSSPLAGQWTAAAHQLLERLLHEQSNAISKAAQWCFESISNDGVVHLFGTGHSRIPIEEMFPRYGSFPGFNPIGELSMTFHTQVVGANGQRQAMFIERVEGLADQILENWILKPQDMLIVFSVNGKSAVPLEMSRGARAAGIKTIAVTSIAQNKDGKPTHSSGTTLIDHVDLAIDLCTPIGDALVDIPGLETRVGPGSTVTAIAIVNEIKVQTADLLVRSGRKVPVITSSSVIGAEKSKKLFDSAYAEHARRISSRLKGANGDVSA
jgi:uncharacterized phosphosugar-binding protein